MAAASPSLPRIAYRTNRQPRIFNLPCICPVAGCTSIFSLKADPASVRRTLARHQAHGSAHGQA